MSKVRVANHRLTLANFEVIRTKMNLQDQLRNWWSSIHLRRSAASVRVECDQNRITEISEGAGEGHRVQLSWDQIAYVFAF